MHRGSMNMALGVGLHPIDIGGTYAQTTGFSVGVNDKVTAVFRTATDYTDTACVCTARQATSSTGANEKAISGLSQTLGGASQVCIMEVLGANLDTGFDYVMFRCTEASDSGVDYVSVDVIGHGSRYKYDGMSTSEAYDSL